MFRVSLRTLINILLLSLWYNSLNKSVLGADYIINTEKCKLPDYKPFNDETIGLWFPESYQMCSNKHLLSHLRQTGDKATVYIEEYLLPLYGRNVSCCVANILRGGDYRSQFPDDQIRWTQCKPFQHEVELDHNEVIIVCRDQLGLVVYENVHYAFLKNTKVKAKINNYPKQQKPLSVLFVVIDSVSRLNFIRTMPKSRDYLLNNDFVEMRGYSKIDDNTYPNFLALLNGLNRQQIANVHCTGRKINELDNCPMIWYNFSRAGYITAYGEDWGNLGTFNYRKKGFTNPPTDYYFRPYVIASEAIGTTFVKGAPYCAGPETSGERQLNLALDFTKTFKGFPYFAIFWMNTFSHQALNIPYGFDDKIREFFTNLKAEGILDDSMVILLSDHGMRIDTTIRRTLSGWFEERLPVNLISVPKWFKEKFPEKIKNLKINSNKLTSTHDLYMTLQDILNFSTPSNPISPSRACSKCVSLFDEVPTRTCSEAGIPPEWCTCIGHLNPLNHTDHLARRGAKFVLEHIKSQFKLYNLSQFCSDFEISYVKTAGLSETSELSGEKYLFLNFISSPYAEFVASLVYKKGSEEKPGNFRLLLDTLRMDKGDDSCIPFSRISLYCNCKRGKKV